MKIIIQKKIKCVAVAFVCSCLFIGLTACNKDVSFTPTPGGQDAPPDINKLDGNCVQVFYDNSTDPTFKFGRAHALMLTNLLGHFPEYQQVVGSIDKYKKGDLERCHASFYIGAVFGNVLPKDFLNDFKTTTRQVVWMGYNFWQLGLDFEKIFGYKDYIFTTLDYTNLTADGKPGFFRDILYKGETFFKFSTWSTTTPPATTTPAPAQTLVAAFEVAKLTNKTSTASVVMAETKHSFTNEVIPWALKANNKFYITESPFSFIHEADRYFVFADLLFDFLKAKPKHNSKNALLRIEDIHGLVELNYLDEAINILKRNSVIPHIMLVPIFKDPLLSIAREGDTRTVVRMEEQTNFASLIQRYKSEGTVFIWHGITHQYHNIKNPFTGASGDDYEFWDSTKSTPVAEDSVSYVLDKFDDGFSSLKKFGIAPKIWVTPHYHGSALDNVMFGQMFSWIIGRGVYSDSKITGLKTLDASRPLDFNVNSTVESQNRRDFFAGLKVDTVAGVKQFGQFYPYEIYGNIYGQNVIPENLGNVQPYLSDQVVATRNVARILEDAKRNLVLRDVWASVFYHPFLLDPALNTENTDATKPKDLERLVTGIKALGYKFVNLDDYVASSTVKKGKPRIELEDVK